MLQVQFFIFGGLTVALGALWAFFYVGYKRSGERSLTDYSRGFFTVIFGVFALVAAFGLIACAIPFAPKYWVVTSESGTVTSIEARSISNGSYVGQEFALKLDGSDDVIVAKDARFMQTKAGDKLNLSCTLQWVPYGKDVRNCVLAD